MFENVIELSILLLCYLSTMVLVTCYKEDTSIANFTWGGGVLLVTLYTFFRMSIFLPQQIIVTCFVTLWAIRLIAYVYIRYTGKDPRFKTWKWQGINALIINSIWIYGQIIMITIMSYPILLINKYNTGHSFALTEYLGIIVWLSGYCIEAMSDQQLFNFIKNPSNKGLVMSHGLWHYSRHPNYFGESVLWFGIYCMALSVPYGWTAIITPITITFLLLYVTGVPLLEKAMNDNPQYQLYKKNTSKFIPWFTKK